MDPSPTPSTLGANTLSSFFLLPSSSIQEDFRPALQQSMKIATDAVGGVGRTSAGSPVDSGESSGGATGEVFYREGKEHHENFGFLNGKDGGKEGKDGGDGGGGVGGRGGLVAHVIICGTTEVDHIVSNLDRKYVRTCLTLLYFSRI